MMLETFVNILSRGSREASIRQIDSYSEHCLHLHKCIVPSIDLIGIVYGGNIHCIIQTSHLALLCHATTGSSVIFNPLRTFRGSSGGESLRGVMLSTPMTGPPCDRPIPAFVSSACSSFALKPPHILANFGLLRENLDRSCRSTLGSTAAFLASQLQEKRKWETTPKSITISISSQMVQGPNTTINAPQRWCLFHIPPKAISMNSKYVAFIPLFA